MSAHLKLVDENGELLTPGCESCAELAGKLSAAENDIELLQGETLRLNRLVGSLRKTRDRERLQHKKRGEVEDIHREWGQITGKKGKLTADRFDAVATLLNIGYEREHFTLAALGAQHNNPWLRPGKKPMVEIETYCRKGTWFEAFVNAGAEYKSRCEIPNSSVESGAGISDPRDSAKPGGPATERNPR